MGQPAAADAHRHAGEDMVYRPALIPLDPSSILGLERIGDGSAAFVLPRLFPQRLAPVFVTRFHGVAFHMELARGFRSRGARFILRRYCHVPPDERYAEA